MSKTTTREVEPLYIITLHDNNAEHKLQNWHKANPRASVSIQGMRMRVYDQRSLSIFQITWSEDWSAIVIWDTWFKRHINLE